MRGQTTFLNKAIVVTGASSGIGRALAHVIDLGPEGGDAGGRLVAVGTPEAVARSRSSFTGHFLQNALASRRRATA